LLSFFEFNRLRGDIRDPTGAFGRSVRSLKRLSVTDHMPEAYRDHFVLKVRRMSKTFQDTSIDFFGCAGAVNMRR
jgi:hypothetical protein